MSKFRKSVGEFVGEAIFLVFGWLVCVSILSGFYFIGLWVAHRGGDSHPEFFGLLSALAMVWLYERREAHERYDRLNERLDNRGR